MEVVVSRRNEDIEEFTYGGCTAVVREEEGRYYILDLFTPYEYRRLGFAKKVLGEIIKKSNNTKKRIELMVCPYNDRPVNTSQLINFYKNFGFYVYDKKECLMRY